jgi:hypothetical protein
VLQLLLTEPSYRWMECLCVRGEGGRQEVKRVVCLPAPNATTTHAKVVSCHMCVLCKRIQGSAFAGSMLASSMLLGSMLAGGMLAGDQLSTYQQSALPLIALGTCCIACS